MLSPSNEFGEMYIVKLSKTAPQNKFYPELVKPRH